MSTSVLFTSILDQVGRNLSWGLVLTALGLLLLGSEGIRALRDTRVPTVGRCGNWPIFKHILAFRGVWNFQKYLEEANEKFLSRNIPCRIWEPTIGALVCLPANCQQWLLAQPEKVIDHHTLSWDLLKAPEFIWYSRAPFHVPIHTRPSRQWLASRFEGGQTELHDAIAAELRRSLGRDSKDWNEVKVYETVADAVHRVTWELCVGEPLCHREDLRKTGQSIYITTFLAGLLADASPWFLRSAVLFLVRLPVRYLFSRLKAIIAPELRLREARMIKSGLEEFQKAGPLDMLTWSIAQERMERAERLGGGTAKSQSMPLDDDTVNKICSEIMVMIVASTHTLSITLSWALLMLLVTPAGQDCVPRIREDVGRVLAEASSEPSFTPDSPLWTRGTIAKMNLVDSVLREVMRLEPISIVFPIWKILEDTALAIPGGPTVRLRRGTRVCLPSKLMHLDEGVYPDAREFRPFRFADRRLPVSTTSSSFLAWSIGRWACPGRYYAANTMKIVIAELLTKYEVELTPETRARREPGMPALRMGMALVPDTMATMKVRFRAE